MRNKILKYSLVLSVFALIGAGIFIWQKGLMEGTIQEEEQKMPLSLEIVNNAEQVVPTSPILLAPQNAGSFAKEISFYELNDCNSIQGLVIYRDEKIGSSMIIARADLENESMYNIQAFDAILNGAALNFLQDLSNVEMIFRGYCGGHYVKFLKEIEGVEYPNSNQVRAWYQLVGQEYPGGPEIVVFAKKGEQYIKLSSMDTKDLVDNAKEACYPRDPKDNDELMDSQACFVHKLATDKSIEMDITDRAKNLTKLFAL